jgi:hypothetical protein
MASRFSRKRMKRGHRDGSGRPRCSKLRDCGFSPTHHFPPNRQRGVVVDDGELWRAEAGTRLQLFQAPGTQPYATEIPAASDGIPWHPNSPELAESTQADSAGESGRAVCAQRNESCSGAVARARARQHSAPLAAGHLNSPHPSRWLSNQRNQAKKTPAEPGLFLSIEPLSWISNRRCGDLPD